ncbi:hypothetical protein ACJX0J_014339 [Zea mays]
MDPHQISRFFEHVWLLRVKGTCPHQISRFFEHVWLLRFIFFSRSFVCNLTIDPTFGEIYCLFISSLNDEEKLVQRGLQCLGVYQRRILPLRSGLGQDEALTASTGTKRKSVLLQ